MKSMEIAPHVYRAIEQSAISSHPEEACGMVFGSTSAPQNWIVQVMENMQNKLHQRDPERHTRNAQTAYSMDALKVQRLSDEHEAQGRQLMAIYHSHPQHPAYFSKTDQRAAMPFGMPTFPNTWQIVVSVFDQVVRDIKAFHWDSDGEIWQETVIKGLPPLPGPPEGAKPLEDD